MRELELPDLFRLSEIIDAMGIELDLNEFMNSQKKTKKGQDIQANVGGELFYKVIKSIHKCEGLVYKFMSSLTGDTVEEVKKYNMKRLKKFATDLVSDVGFLDFFTQD